MKKLFLTVAVIAIMAWSITSCTQEADQPKPAYQRSEETKARLKQEAMESAKAAIISIQIDSTVTERQSL